MIVCFTWEMASCLGCLEMLLDLTLEDRITRCNSWCVLKGPLFGLALGVHASGVPPDLLTCVFTGAGFLAQLVTQAVLGCTFTLDDSPAEQNESVGFEER